jgi:uncharacterized protein (TIGR02611 family)
VAEEASRAQRMRERLAERREAHVRRSRIYRMLFAVAGAAVTLTGVAMLITPGPAFVVIPIGLAMLALEFAWAERLLTARSSRPRPRSARPRRRRAPARPRRAGGRARGGRRRSRVAALGDPVIPG